MNVSASNNNCKQQVKPPLENIIRSNMSSNYLARSSWGIALTLLISYIIAQYLHPTRVSVPIVLENEIRSRKNRGLQYFANPRSILRFDVKNPERQPPHANIEFETNVRWMAAHLIPIVCILTHLFEVMPDASKTVLIRNAPSL